jgi:hypothetical protein
MCAHLLSTIVVDDIPLSRALNSADLYNSYYIECIKSGNSEFYSNIYAEFLVKEYAKSYSSLYHYPEVARVFATSYEIKTKEGCNPEKAWDFSEEYANLWFDIRLDPFPDGSFHEFILARTEASLRYRHNKIYSKEEYISSFETNYHNLRHKGNISIIDASEQAHFATDQFLKNRKHRDEI